MRAARRTLAVLLGAVVLATVLASGVAWVKGWRMYAVRTGSMSPTLGVGALVIDAPPGRGLPRVGQVVTVRTSEGLVSHRVSGYEDDGAMGTALTTKGDANRAPDAWVVPQKNVVGIARYEVPKGGYVLVFLRQPTGVLSLVVLLASIALAWSLFFGDDGRAERAGRRALPAAPTVTPR